MQGIKRLDPEAKNLRPSGKSAGTFSVEEAHNFGLKQQYSNLNSMQDSTWTMQCPAEFQGREHCESRGSHTSSSHYHYAEIARPGLRLSQPSDGMQFLVHHHDYNNSSHICRGRHCLNDVESPLPGRLCHKYPRQGSGILLSDYWPTILRLAELDRTTIGNRLRHRFIN